MEQVGLPQGPPPQTSEKTMSREKHDVLTNHGTGAWAARAPTAAAVRQITMSQGKHYVPTKTWNTTQKKIKGAEVE